MKLKDNIPVFGDADERTMTQIKVCQQTADHVALGMLRIVCASFIGFAVFGLTSAIAFWIGD